MSGRAFLLGLAAALVSWLVAPAPARAACAPVAACVCTVTATPVSFGNYNPLASNDDNSSGTVRVRCTQAVSRPGSFTVDLSTGGSGTYTERRLANGPNTLRYNLYTDSARTQVWGNGTGGSVRVSRSFSGGRVINRNITVYGRIEAGQNVPAGSYSDTILVTVTY